MLKKNYFSNVPYNRVQYFNNKIKTSKLPILSNHAKQLGALYLSFNSYFVSQIAIAKIFVNISLIKNLFGMCEQVFSYT